jgi:hypothetical protein
VVAGQLAGGLIGWVGNDASISNVTATNILVGGGPCRRPNRLGR